jgi:hypothetical protein
LAVEELQGTVDSAEVERAEAAGGQRREAAEARELRELERQERAEARDEASRRAAAGEPHEAPGEDAEAAPTQDGAPVEAAKATS